MCYVCRFYNIYFEGDFILFQSTGCRNTKVGDLENCCDIIIILMITCMSLRKSTYFVGSYRDALLVS